MWPFSKASREESETNVHMREFKEFRSPGQTFKYLGVKMIVRRISFDWYDDDDWAVMDAEYVDAHGRINTKRFLAADLPMLREQQRKRK